jgi:hypothetical protein
MFNATDYNNGADSTSGINFTLQQGQASTLTATITQGNGTTVGTRGYQYQNLTVTLYDTSRGVYVGDVNCSIWVEKNTSVWDSGWTNTTNSTGNCTIRFDPDCTYEGGTRNFRGGVYNDACFVDVNSSSAQLTVDTTGDCVHSVTFELSYDITGSGGPDTVKISNRSASSYEKKRKGEIDHYYLCSYDPLVGNTSFGIIFAGNEVIYLEYNQTDNNKMKITQVSNGNKFIIPMINNTCSQIHDKIAIVESNEIMTEPFESFTLPSEYPIEILLQYPTIDIIGDSIVRGDFILYLEKNETDGIPQIIMRVR